jgi:hypothetical protein
MGAAASSAVGLSGASKTEAIQKQDMITKIFQGLFHNTSDIDIDRLTSPKLCQKYVFHLQRAIQEMREAEKANELKFFIVENTSSDGTGAGFDRVGFHPIKSVRLSEEQLCKNMAVFYLELIFLLYCCSLSTSQQFKPPVGVNVRPPRNVSRKRQTRQRQIGGNSNQSLHNPLFLEQKGGSSPLLDYLALMDKYEKPNQDQVSNPEPFRQVVPHFATADVRPEVLFQRSGQDKKIYFWVISGTRTSDQRVKFWVEFAGNSSDSFDMTFYRCPNPRQCDSSTPVLKGQASITKSFSDNYIFQFNPGKNVLERVYNATNVVVPTNMDVIASILKMAAKADISQLQQNRSFILSQGREDQRVTTLSTSGVSSTAISSVGGFTDIATEFRTFMVRERSSLYQVRRNMLTEAGDRLQAWNTSFNTDHIRKVTEILCRGISHFGSDPKIMSSLSDISSWENLRATNETRYKNSANKMGALNNDKKKQLAFFRDRLDAEHYKYTIDVAKIIEGKLIKKEGINYRINPDFFSTQKTRLSTNAKLNLVVEEIATRMLKYYIALEKITEEALSLAAAQGGTFSY